MITVYSRHEGQLVTQTWDSSLPLPSHVIWLDADRPTAEEIELLRADLGISLPSHEEYERNTTLSRMYKQDGVAFMTMSVITKAVGPYPEIRQISFFLTEHMLITVRDIEPTSFKNFSARLQQSSKDFDSGPEVLHGLLEEMVMRISYNSDLVVSELDDLSHRIFDPYGLQSQVNRDMSMQDVLRRLGMAADLNSQINESLHSFTRMVLFFRELQSDNQYLARQLDIMVNDVRELAAQTNFLSDKITFQLDATLGMINVEQNVIMKIFSVFTVVIMPPTLIGSIYGMNFRDMPELTHPWGYPLALALMLVTAIVPFLYFRHKRWL